MVVSESKSNFVNGCLSREKEVEESVKLLVGKRNTIDQMHHCLKKCLFIFNEKAFRKKIVGILCMCFFVTILIGYSCNSFSCNVVNMETNSGLSFKVTVNDAKLKDITDRLKKLKLDISRLKGQWSTIDPKWSIELESILQMLDPQSMSSQKDWDYSAILPKMKIKYSGFKRHVCPEIYNGRKVGWPFNQVGFDTIKCKNVSRLSNFLTFVFLSSNKTLSSRIIKTFKSMYPRMTVIKLLPKNMKKDGQLLSVITGESLNRAIKNVTTPFVFFANILTHFNRHSSLIRLVRVLDELKYVGAAAGSARDLQGHWNHGCLQHKFINYKAKYTMGYYYSKYECMYCDDLLNPFVTYTELVRNVSFSKTFYGPSIFRDWFIRIRQRGLMTLVCPDVMFYVNNHIQMKQNDWNLIGVKHQFDQIMDYNKEVYSIPCSESLCKNVLGITGSFLLPPCCIRQMKKYLFILIDYANKNNLYYELQAGSALGAVKFDSYLPWDYDHDIHFVCKDYSMWLNIREEESFINASCKLNIIQNGKYLTAQCPIFFLELYCHQNKSTKFLPESLKTIPTSIFYENERWVNVPSNPALFARNRMGFEILRHASHWRHIKKKDRPQNMGGYKAGQWSRSCVRPWHHSCLDKYPADGNLPFRLEF